MKKNLFFDFIANKEDNTITVKREFAADRQLVWDCHTKSDILDQWFAPKPLNTKTKSMEFKVGGHWHYAMVDPNGTEYWGWTGYTKISPIDFYETTDAFSDSKGTINKNLPKAVWRIDITDQGPNTLVQTKVTYNSLNDLETVLNMGMKDGLMSTLEKLDELLIKLTKK